MAKNKRIALFGGSFNPPGLHHLEMAKVLSENFDEVIVIPCGPRPDKKTTNDIAVSHRAAMVELAFKGLEKVRLDLFDLENLTFTRTYRLQERYQKFGDIWHVVGGDLVQNGALGDSEIQKSWERGLELWFSAKFVIFSRAGFPVNAEDLPPNNMVFALSLPGSSGAIRRAVSESRNVRQYLPEAVADYIERYQLYTK